MVIATDMYDERSMFITQHDFKLNMKIHISDIYQSKTYLEGRCIEEVRNV